MCRNSPFLKVILVCLVLFGPGLAQSGRPMPENNVGIPAPETVLGFRIGTDRKLAKWEKFVAYFQHLADLSDRVIVEQPGKTTLGRPFIVATISAPENLRRLDELKEIQTKLADPRLVTSAPANNGQPQTVNDLVQRGKTVVVITCSIHSTEVGGTFTATELAWRLASSNAPQIRQILDNVIILLVPSLNPDGTDIVADWYERTLGTPAEGTSPPELYHHYTGHDNNRDWYAFTQVETQLTVDKILNVWHPQILHDIHQMGGGGARFFVPPYTDPWEPNIDPALTSAVNALGSTMAWELTAQGKRGVITSALFDAWTPARAWAHYHAGLRILSETASARLATPVESPAGQSAAQAKWNYPQPWTGGRWTIRDIIDYQSAGALALLAHAAKYREQYLRNFYDIGRRAIEPRPGHYAWLLPEPELPASIATAAREMREGIRTRSSQDEKSHQATDATLKKLSGTPATSEEVGYFYKTEGLDRLLAILKRGGVEVLRARGEFTADGRKYPAGTHIVLLNQPYAAFARTLLERQVYPDLRQYPGGPPQQPYDVVAHTLPLLLNVSAIAVREPFTVETQKEPTAIVLQSRVRSNPGVRVGLYQNYAPAMDEGWTRWVFDQYRFPYTRLTHHDIRAGGLREKYDAIILPDQSAAAIVQGLPAASYPAEFAGGLGDAGIQALREFLAAGGTIITFNDASNFAIEHLGVPVRNALKGVAAQEFYCPGSILRTHLDTDHPLSFGMDGEAIAWFEHSPVFVATDPERVKVIARYADDANPLLSGWILGDQMLRGKAALVEVGMGRGRVVMFGFRPQYRGQSLATVPLLFNAILTSRTE